MDDLIRVLLSGLRAGLGPNGAILALAAVGLNIHYGYTGLLNFGQAGFMLVGGYGTAIAVAQFDLSLWIGIPIGLGAAVLFGLLIGLPTLRLRADYFAIMTIAAAEILRFFVKSSPATDLTGGPFRLPFRDSVRQSITTEFQDLNPFNTGIYGYKQFSLPHNQLWATIVTWGLVIVAILVVSRLAKSPWGRVIKSIRENEDVPRSLGKNVFAYKIQSLVIGGMIGAMAGIMQVIVTNSARSGDYGSKITFYAYAALILGGAATTWGPAIGAAIFWFLVQSFDVGIRTLDSNGWLPDFLSRADSLGAYAELLVGLGIVALMIFRPQGIFGNRQEMLAGA